MNIAAGSKNKTLLNSNLTEIKFAKVSMNLNLNDEGFIVSCKKSDLFSIKTEPKNSEKLSSIFSFEPWKFDGTLTDEKSDSVLFSGSGFEGRTLLSVLFSESDSPSSLQAKNRAAFAFACSISAAIIKGVSLPQSGPGGILYSETGSRDGMIKLLFLPGEIYNFSAANYTGDNKAALQNLFKDKNISGSKQLAFIRAAVLYAALTGIPPFSAEELSQRQADILDANFLPLKNRINGISPELSDAVSMALEYKSLKNQADYATKKILEEKTGQSENCESDIMFPLSALQDELGLDAKGNYTEPVRKKSMSDSDFSAEAAKLEAKKKRSAGKSRLIRRNKTSLIIAAIIGAFISIGAQNVYKDSLTKATTVSLTARETAEAFFTGMHKMNIELMYTASSGHEVKPLIDMISNLYVTSKTRSAFDYKDGTLTPEVWLYRHDLREYWQFGITNFKIDDSSLDLISGETVQGADFDSLPEANNRFIPPVKKDKRPAIEIDGERKVYDGQVREKLVSFYRVSSAGVYKVSFEGNETPSEIQVVKVQGKITLTFRKNTWAVTGIKDLTEEETLYDAVEFENDFSGAMEKSGGDAIKAVSLLYEKYPWLPTQNEMNNARLEAEEAKRRQ